MNVADNSLEQNAGVLKEKISKKKIIAFIIGFGAIIVGFLLPEVGGISTMGWRALSVLVFAIVFWATEALPVAITAMAIMVLIPVLGILDYASTMSKMGTIMIWRLVALFIITEAIRRSGLANRIAFAVLSLTKGRVKLTLFCVLLLNFFFCFLIPNGYSRTVLLVTIMVGWLESFNIRGNIAKMFMIAIPVVSSLTSSAIIVGASVDIFAVDLFSTMVGYRFTYMNWLIMNLPVCFIMTIVVYFLAVIVFKPEMNVVSGSHDITVSKLKEMGKLKQPEKVMIVLFIGLLILWFSDVSEKIPAEMLIAILIVFPTRFRLLSVKEALKTVNWGVVFLFGASLAMASGLQSSGAVSWLAENVFSHMNGLSPFLIALLVIAFTALVRLGMTNMTGAGATLLPILITVAQGISVNPVWLGMICVMATCICFFFPSQSTNNLFPYGFGYYENKDLLRFGLALFPVYAVILSLLAMFYWPLVGIGIYS
jgi:anion transporter